MTKFKNFYETTKHKLWVFYYILKMCFVLLKRAFVHDLSKYSKYEEPYFRKYVSRLKNCKYGTGQYQSLLSAIKPALDHHYSKNSHHPEHHKNGIDDMSYFDILEMLVDWQAAGKRHKGGNLKKSIELNSKRFGYNELMKQRLLKTAQELKILD